MYRDPELYQRFLSELQALQAFRERYLSLYPRTPLMPNDPDVRHLIEALAFFSARSQRASETSLQHFYHRLFAQYFPFLLHPLPATGLLEGTPTRRLVEDVALPAGSEIRLEADGGDQAIFRTTADLQLTPMWLERVDTAAAPGGLYLRFHMRTERPVETVNLFVHHLDAYWPSAKLMDDLKSHSVEVRVGKQVDIRSAGQLGQMALGTRQVPGSPPAGDGQHPLARLRRIVNQPEAEHWVNVQLPSPQHGRFQIAIFMDDRWAPDPHLTRHSFRTFVVPIINLNPAPADPIRFDGTRTRTRIRPVEPGASLCAVRGVYQVRPEGLSPLRPGVIPGPGGSYEAEPGSWLRLRIPEALQEPVTISVEADWYNPEFSRHAATLLKVMPYRRKIDGVRWSLVGPLRPHVPPASGDRVLFFLQALSLRTRPEMDREELVVLLRMLGGLEQGPYHTLIERLESVQVAQKVHADDGTPSLQQRYTLRFAEVSEEDAYQLRVLAHHIDTLLDAWLIQSNAHILIERISEGAP